MSVVKDVMAAACVAAGVPTVGGALFLAVGGTAQAVPRKGTCILALRSYAPGGTDPCTGTCGPVEDNCPCN